MLRRSVPVLVFAVLMAALHSRDAAASCDLIPGVSLSYRGALGSIDRPFAAPGDFLTVRLTSPCDDSSTGLAPAASGHVVSIVFTPPSTTAGTDSVIVLADDCDSLGSESEICGSDLPEIGRARCIDDADGSGLQLVGRCAAGDRAGLLCTLDANCPSSTCTIDALRFRFPNTDEDLAPDGDEVTLSGPVHIAVTKVGGPIPCGLVSDDCAGQSDLVACIDNFYSRESGCDTTSHELFPGFTALPFPNSYSALCYEPAPPCTASASELRFTTDVSGNILVPMDWRGILVGQGVPIARLLRGSSAIAANSASPTVPILVPGNEFLGSFSPEGGLLPPIFDPQADPTASDEVTLFGSADAPSTVLRIERRAASHTACNGGDNDGLSCYVDDNCPLGLCEASVCTGGDTPGVDCLLDSDCSGGECGPSLFDFSDRYDADVGPVLIPRIGSGVCQAGDDAGLACANNAECSGGHPCVTYRLEARDPAPLDGLAQTNDLNAIVVQEGVNALSLNDDEDTTDDVILISDRDTGILQPIGGSGRAGRAVVRIRQAPFSFAAMSAEGGLAAFLEFEPDEGYQDANGNGDVFDTILRIYRADGSDVLPGLNLAADAAPLINGRSVLASGGLVFARIPEAANAKQIIEETSVASDGSQGNFHAGWNGFNVLNSMPSADGRILAFQSSASNLGGPAGIFWRNRATGITESIAAGARDPDVSTDGRFVVYRTGTQIELFDRCVSHGTPVAGCTPSTEAISITPGGDPGAMPSHLPSITPDGRFVLFFSDAGDLVAGDANGVMDTFIRDRCRENGDPVPACVATTRRVSLAHDGAEGNATAAYFYGGKRRISGDGRFAVFESEATNLVPGDTNGVADTFLRDTCLSHGVAVAGCSPTTELVSLRSDGSQAGYYVFGAGVSDDGRFVLLQGDPSLVPVGGGYGVYVRDRLNQTTERIDLSVAGTATDNSTYQSPTMSPDGRWIAYTSEASNIVPDDTNQAMDAFLHDRLTGATRRVNIASDGTETNDGYCHPLTSDSCTDNSDCASPNNCDRNVYGTAVSVDGSLVAFTGSSAALVDGDANGRRDHFVRVPGGTCTGGIADGADCTADYQCPGGGCDLPSDESGDGDVVDTLLHVFDSAGDPTELCPANETAVQGTNAAFLRPERAGTSSAPACSGGALSGPDLNSDGDVADDVVHVWNPTDGARNFKCPASAVAIADGYVAALVSEANSGAGGTDVNSDGDKSDNVAMIHALSSTAPASCTEWTNSGLAAESIALNSTTLAILASEQSQGGSLNGDSDDDDRVVEAYALPNGPPVALGAAADMVLGKTLLAFRTPESAEGNTGTDLNGDGDKEDDVLQVYDPEFGGKPINTGQAILPCRLEACDPRFPYRVLNDTIAFLTLEAQQSEDLNLDGDLNDLVRQTFNVRRYQSGEALSSPSGIGRSLRLARTTRSHDGVNTASLTTVAAVSAGVCTSSGLACASDADCPGGACFVPPGGCVRSTGAGCNTTPNLGDPPPCPGADQYCQPVVGGGLCFKIEGPCASTADCSMWPGATCNDGEGPDSQRLVDPLSTDGNLVVPSTGRCVEDLGSACVSDANCAPGAFCQGGTCHHEQQTCTTDADCTAGGTCSRGVATAVARDSDGDELADPYDNCPFDKNVAQEDGDSDGAGDACDPCGNGDVDDGEQCDDGNADDTDCCPNDCQLAPSNKVCRAATGPCDLAERCTGSSVACPADVFAGPTSVCRSGSGICDPAETCSGSTAACPSNTFALSTTVCRGAASVCDIAERCSGSTSACPVNVFLPTTTVCRGSAGVCDAAENCTGTSGSCPSNTFASTTTVCRSGSGICDSAETCTGTSAACPTNGFASTTTVCRTASGACDAAETCTGTSAACPGNGFLPSSSVCRAVAGVCDVAERCTGTGSVCPTDLFAPTTVPCRSGGGVCDPAENCNGSAAACPTNAFATTTTVCRTASGVCDTAETCSGSGGACPADVFVSTSMVCRTAAGVCDPAENCTGTSGSCPLNGFASTSTVCRAAAGTCDVQETCSGSSANCPTNVFAASSVVCGTTGGACEVQGTCTGTSATCPANGFLPSSTVCRPAAGVCDVVEICTGSSGNCPFDVFAPTTTPCRSGGGVCDPSESCSGSAATCPGDAFAATTTTCRASIGVCDSAEFCTGTGGACPPDAVATTTTVCRSAGGVCDMQENCDGSTKTCPTDGFVNALTACPSDGNECTDDVCSGSSVTCTHLQNSAPCDDGIFCNGADACADGSCSVHPGDPCAEPDTDGDCSESCNEVTDDCSAADPDGTVCNDGDPCTTADSCSGGSCSGTNSDCTTTTTTTLPEAICGDANDDGRVTAADALQALKAAVGSTTCAARLCDYTGDGRINASDALAILRVAVGQDVPPNCPVAKLAGAHGHWERSS